MQDLIEFCHKGVLQSPHFWDCIVHPSGTGGKANLSAYEVKNNLRLFERPLKENNNGVFLFWISSLVPEIFKFLFKN